MIEVIAALADAKQLIADPEDWSPDGPQYDREDKKMCALDALAMATNALDSVWAEAYRALYDAVPRPYVNVGSFNDSDRTTHADIMALFDRAIEHVEKEQQS